MRHCSGMGETMQIRNKTLRLTVAAAMLALSVLIPMLFHFFPLPDIGKYILPMHLPVFLCGILCGPLLGFLVGLLAPVLSFLLTSMPAVVRLPFMVLELGTYGLTIGIFYQIFRRKKDMVRIYLSLILAMISGRIVFLAALAVMVFGFHAKGLSLQIFVEAITLGSVGIVLQFIVLPLLVRTSLRFYRRSCRDLLGDENTFVCKKGKRIHKSHKRGVAPMLDLLQNDPDMLRGSQVIDKVIGRAAAFLLIKGKVTKLYAEVISKPALELLYADGTIDVSYGKCVENIINRTGDDICPMEKATLQIADVQEAYEAIVETLHKLQNKTEGEQNG